MRIFVTGATGFIGSAIVRELLDVGHQVLGLARNDDAAEKLARLGVEAHRGKLSDLESLAAGARVCDGVIHTAFNHDFSDLVGASETDRRAVEAFGAELAGTGRPLVIASAIGLLMPGRLATEDVAGDPGAPGGARLPSEETALALALKGVTSSIVRLPPVVHDQDKQGLATMMIGLALQKGVSAYVGDGLNRWPGVHRLDAARLFRLALEKGSAGARYHAVADEGVPVREIAEVIGRCLNVPVVSKSPKEAVDYFGWLAYFLAADYPASSAQTQERLGWRPTHTGLIPDLDQALQSPKARV